MSQMCKTCGKPLRDFPKKIVYTIGCFWQDAYCSKRCLRIFVETGIEEHPIQTKAFGRKAYENGFEFEGEQEWEGGFLGARIDSCETVICPRCKEEVFFLKYAWQKKCSGCGLVLKRISPGAGGNV